MAPVAASSPCQGRSETQDAWGLPTKARDPEEHVTSPRPHRHPRAVWARCPYTPNHLQRHPAKTQGWGACRGTPGTWGRVLSPGPCPPGTPTPRARPAGAGGTCMLGMMRRKRKTMSTFTSRVMSHSDSRPSVAGLLQTQRRVSRQRDAGDARSRDRRREGHRGARKPPHRRHPPEKLRRDGRAEPEPAAQGAHGSTSQGTAPCGAGQRDGRTRGRQMPSSGPSRAGRDVAPDPSPILGPCPWL